MKKSTESHQACPPDWARRRKVRHGLWVGYVGCCLFCVSKHYTSGLGVSLQSGNLVQSAGHWTCCPLPEQWRHPGSSPPTHGLPLPACRACPKTLPGPPEPNTGGPLPGPAQLLPLNLDRWQLVAQGLDCLWPSHGDEQWCWGLALSSQRRSRHNPSLILCIPSPIPQESEIVRCQVKLVKDGKLARYQRTAYREKQGKIFQLWDKYEQRDLTTKQLLKACSHLTGPTEWSPCHLCLSRDLRVPS